MPPRLKRGKREEEEEEEERERKKEPRRPTRRTRGDDECEVERTRHWKVGLVGDTHGMFDESLRCGSLVNSHPAPEPAAHRDTESCSPTPLLFSLQNMLACQ
jgi:hypothetical protein